MMSYRVNLEDKFTLDYILIKYFQIWQDINRNRKIYAGSLSDNDWLFEAGFNEESYKLRRRDHIRNLLDVLPLGKKDLVENVLKDLFPEVKNALNEGVGRSFINLLDLRDDRRVGHPDILDTYFGASLRTEQFESEQKIIKRELGSIKNYSLQYLIPKFINLNAYAENNNDFFTLLREYIRKQFIGEQIKQVYKAWLTAYLSETDYLVREENSGLIRIIAGIDQLAGSMGDADERDKFLDFIFKNIHTKIRHPSSALRLLLYIHPSRQNHLNTIMNYSKLKNVYIDILNFVDKYYLNRGHNVFTESDFHNGEWRFIIYQWSLSVSNSGDKNPLVGKNVYETRYKKVNEYVFTLLHKNERLIYPFLKHVFWQRDINDDKYKWKVTGNLVPYMPEKLVIIIDKYLLSRSSTGGRAKEVQELRADLIRRIPKDIKKELGLPEHFETTQ